MEDHVKIFFINNYYQSDKITTRNAVSLKLIFYQKNKKSLKCLIEALQSVDVVLCRFYENELIFINLYILIFFVF